MTLIATQLAPLAGGDTNLAPGAGLVTLVVNVASKCGLTPQYEGLERLQKRFAGRGFTVLGVPCNQFRGQEPGTAEEIAEFCSAKYGVTFPMAEKVDVNGALQHPLYAQLTQTADASGYTGDVRWNFEKFLVSADGSVLGRFDPQTEPESEVLLAAIEAALAA